MPVSKAARSPPGAGRVVRFLRGSQWGVPASLSPGAVPGLGY